jgi:hypothetical protein
MCVKLSEMIESVIIEPMTEDFILWRCLHSGPLSRATIGQWPPDNPLPWERYCRRNVPLLLRLTQTYGACAIIARDGDQIVGQLRFYPKAVWNMPGAGELCLQQDFPSGPADDFAQKDFPAPAGIKHKTLLVHCLMTGSPQQAANPYQRKGLGTRMVKTLIQWAKANGWQWIEARAFEDLPIIYEITGSTGHAFWEKLGFVVVERQPHLDLQAPSEFVTTLESQAKSLGISPERAKEQIMLRLGLA